MQPTIIALFAAVQIAIVPAVLARNVTPAKHHKAFNGDHQVVAGSGHPRTSSAPRPMAEPEKPSPGY